MPFDPVGYVETKIVDADGEVLRRAADIIEQRGWCQGAYEVQGAVCLWGALNVARGYAANLGFAVGDGALACRLGPCNTSWNDTPGRTKAEVIARLRSAAEQGAS